MPRHIIGRTSELPPGSRRLAHVGGKAIVVFNIKGELFALSDTCPHRGASLSNGVLTGLVTSTGPGDYSYAKPGEIIRCPWHQWEFDVRTGRSHCDPKRMRLMQFSACVEAGTDLVGEAAEPDVPLVAETFAIEIDDSYIVIDVPE